MRIESADKITGFRAGTDYIVRPFDLDKLGARATAYLWRDMDLEEAFCLGKIEITSVLEVHKQIKREIC